MTRLIDVLREEHRNIERLLGVLEQELTVFDRRDRPDFDTLRAVIDYFEEYPARCHHPKEDMMVDLMRARDPVLAAKLDGIETDHREEADRLIELARTIESVRTGCDLPRESVVDVVREFIAHERRHIALEERELFPSAQRVLRPSDWASLEARMGDARDPLFNGTIEGNFRSLADKILQWERENEDDRRHSPAAVKS